MRGEVTKDARAKLDSMGIKWAASSITPETKTIMDAGPFHIVLTELPINAHKAGLMMQVSTGGAISFWAAIEATATLANIGGLL